MCGSKIFRRVLIRFVQRLRVSPSCMGREEVGTFARTLLSEVEERIFALGSPPRAALTGPPPTLPEAGPKPMAAAAGGGAAEGQRERCGQREQP